MKRINMKITDEMHELLKSNAEKRGLTMNSIVIVAIEEYLKKEGINNDIKKK